MTTRFQGTVATSSARAAAKWWETITTRPAGSRGRSPALRAALNSRLSMTREARKNFSCSSCCHCVQRPQDLLINRVVEDQLAAVAALRDHQLGDVHHHELALVEPLSVVRNRRRPHLGPAAPRAVPGERSAGGLLEPVGCGVRHRGY